MKRRRDRQRVPVDMIDTMPFGGHDLEQIPDHEDESDYFYRCTGCHGVVAGVVLEDDMWQLVVGAWCPALLMKEGR